jgi:hypothetical protein
MAFLTLPPDSGLCIGAEAFRNRNHRQVPKIKILLKVPLPSVRSGTFTAFKARPFFDDAFPATQSITAGHTLRFSRILLSDNQHLS